MKFPTTLLTLFLTLVVVNASVQHEQAIASRSWHSRRHSSVKIPSLEKKSSQKRCVRRGTKTDSASTSTKKATPKTTSSAKPSPSSGSSKSNNSGNNYSSGGSSKGQVLTASGKCGASNAVAKTTKTSGPNGSIQFLNCGIDAGGWTPPKVNMKDIVAMSLTEALKSGNSPFKACSSYLQYFNKYGAQYNIPPIMLASFAMQESSCKPETVGGAGEQGLMQITKDKCGGAPGGNCRDPDFNIHAGAKYFAATLDSLDGDVLLAVGQYNGWYPGLTVGKAEAAKKKGCCRCQQNLDYLQQLFNGWLQNINAYDADLGLYFNLASCPLG
ncbi:hypothetical protein NP233_g3591 [Leucocoprinus birnbaumii]|uniref:Transglycosylase SLT domain-containing protein n=1 Tax=Leucocoprinus birnbaumii TaxID=56174 RepID=A0AAD5YXV7_9AGAR|nr:hypothetical protein NP233_g3591 [Leucocoprinus birnbaumii]